MAEVSDAGVAALFSQPASRRTAVNARIVFIVTPGKGWSAVNEPDPRPSLSPDRDATAKLRGSIALSRSTKLEDNEPVHER
jgi:hypothetical protein